MEFLLVFISMILGIVALRRTGKIAAEVAAVRRELSLVRIATTQAPTVAPPEAPAAPPEPSRDSVRTAPAEPEPDAARPATWPASERVPATAVASSGGPSRLGLERNLTGRWTIWLGAVTLALSAVFLVKYSIEQDLLGPGVRIGFGVLMGVALIAGALRMRVTASQRPLKPLRADHIPAALAAAGVADLFATIYAAFALYDFLGPLPAFALLTGIAALAVGLSLLYGPFIALLGLAGAFVVPLLVPSDHPSAWGLFLYLLVVVTGSLAVLRFKAWWWLGHVALAGSSLWTLIWLIGSWHASDTPVVGFYLVLSTAAFLHFARGAIDVDDTVAGWRAARSSPGFLLWAACIAASLVMVLLASIAEEATAALVAAAALMGLQLAMGRRHAAFDGLAFLAGTLGVLLIATWEFGPVLRDVTGRIAVAPHGLVPVFADAFVTTATCFAALLAGAGFLAQWGAARPGRWAALASAMPILILVTVYWRLGDFAVSLPWTLVGLALAVANLAASWGVARHREAPGMEAALAAYAVGVIAATGFAATMSLRHAWLSVALAITLPGIGWVAHETRVAALRPTAIVIAAIVLVRLLLNPGILDYAAGDGLLINWLLYGYGIPSAAFFVAARAFHRDRDDALVMVLEGGAIALVLAFVTLELHQLFGDGNLASPHYGMAESALQVDLWGAGALALLYRAGTDGRPVVAWGWRIVAGIAALHLVAVQMLGLNPLVMPVSVGATPFFNLLLLAYAVPALLAALIGREARRQGATLAALVAGGFAFVLGFAALSLELHQLFNGANLTGAHYDFAEAAFQVDAWAVAALVLLYCAGRRPRPVLIWGWRIAAGITAIHLALIQMLALNPLLVPVSVGETPILNLLLPAYAVPAIVAALIRREAERQGEAPAAVIAAGGVALVLGFAALSLELRQWFHGGMLLGPTGDAEIYGYSVVWLIYGAALLAVGIRRAQPALRLAALALLTLTVGKAFLFDMSNLTGLYRAASFLGLGLCLIGIGYLYQRVVFPPPAARSASDMA